MYLDLIIKSSENNYKVHLFGGISRKGLNPLVIFTGTIYSKDYQNFISASIRRKFLFNRQSLIFHENDPKHTSSFTKLFMIFNNINHFEKPRDLMPIEIVWIKKYIFITIFNKTVLLKVWNELKRETEGVSNKKDLIRKISRLYFEKRRFIIF